MLPERVTLYSPYALCNTCYTSGLKLVGKGSLNLKTQMVKLPQFLEMP